MISRCKCCKNRFFNTFFPLSHTFYFETRPSPLSKLGENAFGAHFLQLYLKNEYGDPQFLFNDFNRDSASFRWEKNWHKSMFSFLAILPNCTDWAGLKEVHEWYVHCKRGLLTVSFVLRMHFRRRHTFASLWGACLWFASLWRANSRGDSCVRAAFSFQSSLLRSDILLKAFIF